MLCKPYEKPIISRVFEGPGPTCVRVRFESNLKNIRVTEKEMSKRVWWLFPALLLVGSCATTYTHPTKSSAQFERDRAVCESIARKKLAARGIT